MTPELYAACEKAVHVLTRDGEILRAGRASLFVLERCGYTGIAHLLRLPFVLPFVELGYWIVSHNRDLFAGFLFRNQSEYGGDLPISPSEPIPPIPGRGSENAMFPTAPKKDDAP